jgi:hypothetical protein
MILSLAFLLQTLVSQYQLRVATLSTAMWEVNAPLPVTSIPAQGCAEGAIPAPGLSPGMSIAPGWPVLPDGVFGMMYSGNDTVMVRLCNVRTQLVTISGSLPTVSASILWRRP